MRSAVLERYTSDLYSYIANEQETEVKRGKLWSGKSPISKWWAAKLPWWQHRKSRGREPSRQLTLKCATANHQKTSPVAISEKNPDQVNILQRVYSQHRPNFLAYEFRDFRRKKKDSTGQATATCPQNRQARRRPQRFQLQVECRSPWQLMTSLVTIQGYVEISWNIVPRSSIIFRPQLSHIQVQTYNAYDSYDHIYMYTKIYYIIYIYIPVSKKKYLYLPVIYQYPGTFLRTSFGPWPDD